VWVGGLVRGGGWRVNGQGGRGRVGQAGLHQRARRRLWAACVGDTCALPPARLCGGVRAGGAQRAGLCGRGAAPLHLPAAAAGNAGKRAHGTCTRVWASACGGSITSESVCVGAVRTGAGSKDGAGCLGTLPLTNQAAAHAHGRRATTKAGNCIRACVRPSCITSMVRGDDLGPCLSLPAPPHSSAPCSRQVRPAR
jgi:hypothetical protein